MSIKLAILLLASLVAVSHGASIECTFSSMSLPGQYSTTIPYGCSGYAQDDGNTAVTIVGVHSGGNTDANVQAFYSNGYMVKIYSIPSELATRFPNLVAINLDYMKIRTLTAADLLPFPNLIALSLQMNHIRYLSGDVFNNNPHLKYVNLAYNSIQSVGAGFLSTNTALVELQFQYNRCLGQSMYMQSGPDYTVANYVSDVKFLCGPYDSSSGGGVIDSCPANCSASATALEAQLDSVEAVFTEPCWVRLMRIFKTWFNL